MTHKILDILKTSGAMGIKARSLGLCYIKSGPNTINKPSVSSTHLGTVKSLNKLQT